VPLTRLKELTLHANPWSCDCKLKGFRDFTVQRKLYTRPTSCAEPSRLSGRAWDEVAAADFACKPEVRLPVERVFAAPGVDVELACHIMGSPKPDGR